MSEFCLSEDTAACDVFLHLSEATGSSRVEGIRPSSRRLLRARFTGRGKQADEGREEQATEHVAATSRDSHTKA